MVASIEGSRSYGVGLSRALSAAGLPVLEAEQPKRSSRRGKGQSDADQVAQQQDGGTRLRSGLTFSAPAFQDPMALPMLKCGPVARRCTAVTRGPAPSLRSGTGGAGAECAAA